MTIYLVEKRFSRRQKAFYGQIDQQVEIGAEGTHGVRRVVQSAEEAEARKRHDHALIQNYLKLTDDILSRKKNNDLSEDAFKLTTELLRKNPEFYTVWNYRRIILLRGLFEESSPEEVFHLLSEELSLTMTALQNHPKVYWIWNHRRWALEHIPEGPDKCWNKELEVLEGMLKADPRNFHAWNYRRYVLSSLPNPRKESEELTFTLKKIVSNFSNFSAWHQRSKTLSFLWSSGKLDEAKSREDEFELIRNAMYTDPNDQSVWIYHRWLVGSGDSQELLEREIEAIQELLEEEPSSKWCMESIVHYKCILLKKHSHTVNGVELKRTCGELLRQLEQLDSLRRNRYQEIGAAGGGSETRVHKEIVQWLAWHRRCRRSCHSCC
ncbi:rab-protein geranylgeranyltransferase [Cyathus striatus]|nr:rab-protein geranylgeranyltransferase [Cyathus striatus]